MNIIADTGFIVAHNNIRDDHHQACLTLYKSYAAVIAVPQSVLAEVGYLLRKARGNRQVASFLRQLSASKYEIVPLTVKDLARTADILDQYHDSRLDFVDASIVAIAERLNITRILTLDQRDFGMVRPRHASHFELLPQPEA
jgi:predicted nucleic acid-binding protein